MSDEPDDDFAAKLAKQWGVAGPGKQSTNKMPEVTIEIEETKVQGKTYWVMHLLLKGERLWNWTKNYSAGSKLDQEAAMLEKGGFKVTWIPARPAE